MKRLSNNAFFFLVLVLTAHPMIQSMDENNPIQTDKASETQQQSKPSLWTKYKKVFLGVGAAATAAATIVALGFGTRKFIQIQQAKNEAIVKPIRDAITSGSLRVLKQRMEEKNINPNIIIDNFNRTPLISAVENGKKDIVVYLLKDLNANIETPNAIQHTPLYIAIQHNKPDIALLLVNRGARLDNIDGYGLSAEKAIEQAVEFRPNRDMDRLLITIRAKQNLK